MKRERLFKELILDDWDLSESTKEYKEGYNDGIDDAIRKSIEKKPLAFFGGMILGAVIVSVVVLGTIALYGLVAGFSYL